jgi:ubiquinone/menaquinone biosynthesis C-methylase UbiE
LRNSYKEGLNLTELITGWGFPIDFETITLIYDLQAGTYTEHAAQNTKYIDFFTSEIVNILGKYLDKDMSVLDCGTGEGTTLIPILKKLGISSGYGIDASISRLLWAQKNAVNAKFDLTLAVSDLGNLPLGDNAVDAIMTVHALEPNGGQENFLINELGRVARKFVFLIEPDFENGSVEQKARMIKLGYITSLDEAIRKNGFKILEKIPMKSNSNELNAASITVIQITKINPQNSDLVWTDPKYKNKLNPYMNGLRSTFGLWYPMVNGIPLLRETDTQYLFSPPQ